MNEGLHRHVEKAIARHHLLADKAKVLVALSGGADSVALLLVLQRLGYRVMAAHCNFHLRGDESMRDETFVRELCLRHDIPLTVESFDTKSYATKYHISIEMAARDLRYAWFERLLVAEQAEAICVAHHRQDQAETLLLNLLRGSGLRGMAGMHYRNGHIVRPMLDASKEDIIAYLQQRGERWVEDSTNQERDALRNRIRLDVIPLLQQLNPQAVKNIAMTATHAQEALSIYERGLKATAQQGSIATLTELHEALSGCGFNRTQLSDIWHARQGAIIASPTHRLLKDRKAFLLQSIGDAPQAPELSMQVVSQQELGSMQPGTLYLDNDTLQKPLQLRLARQGDVFTPFGMRGRKLVSDVLTNLKLNRYEREQQYVLTDAADNILWVVGRRAANLYRVTLQTHNVLCVSVKQYHRATITCIAYETREDD